MIMQRFAGVILLQALFFSLFAQIEQHTRWTFSAQQTAPGEFEVTYSCKLDPGWHIYSQFIEEGGPIPTVFTMTKDARIIIPGKPLEKGKAIKQYDEIFAMELTWFEKKVDFIQQVKAKPGAVLKGGIEFMTCSDVDGKCVVDDVTFSIPLAVSSFADSDSTPASSDTIPVAEAVPLSSPKTSSTVSASKFDWSIVEKNDCSVPKKTSRGNWMIFLLGFGGGLLALLTPCVFPMVPLTVSFFTKGGKEKGKGVGKAISYGISIIIIYILLGILITGLFGADALNAMSTNIYFNLLFFIVFVVFAISFFGFFEITLPSSWANASDTMADRGGMLGIFFMAFTLSLVSFSCTGPIIGTLLVEAATGGGPTLFGHIPLKPLIGMFGFSLALALPFTLFALFPQWLKSLPQSGGWMNVVKVILGFLELALALKFLSVVDMTQNWGILRIEVFLGLWILIFLGLAVYALGYIRFPHEEKTSGVGIARKLIALVAIVFCGYLMSGYSYKPLKLLSGLAPPAHYNFKKKIHKSDNCPAGLDCFHDYDEALAYAKKVNKPLLIDFTGYGCVNCRKMEENVWTEPSVNRAMKNFILVSLYVDDRKPLPETEQYTSDASGREKLVKTVGNKWSDFQALHFKINSQPFYVLVSPGEQVLNQPEGYMPNAVDYEKFLQCGLSAITSAP